jgi:hypothetical protein
VCVCVVANFLGLCMCVFCQVPRSVYVCVVAEFLGMCVCVVANFLGLCRCVLLPSS